MDLAIDAPEEALIGVPFDFRVEFSNQSGSVLKDVNLTVSLPDGAVFAGSGEDKLLANKNLGNVGEGSLIAETYQIVFLRGGNTSQEIKSVISYAPGNLRTHFETVKKAEIAVRESGVAVELVGPEKVFNGEEFSFDLVYRNVSELDFSNLELRLEYPPSFTFLGSSLEPDKGKNTWTLGDLRKGSEGTFAITGSIIGPENATADFKFGLTANIAGKNYDLEIKPFTMTIAPSSLGLSVVLNNKPEYIAKANDDLNYVISYINNTDTTLRDVVIRAQVVGEMFDLGLLNTDGLFRSSDNKIIWNSQTTPSLGVVSPSSAGFVKFSIKTKASYPIRRFGDKNFVLRINAEIESPTPPDSGASSRTYSLARLDSKVSGNIVLDVRGYFRDAEAGILNKGTMPPRVGQPTNFTVHWVLKNFANDISGLEIRSELKSGVQFTGVAKSNFGPLPFYDEKNRQLVWQLDKLSANKGVVDQPLEAIFQIEATPSANQVGNYMPLLGETMVKALDSFTGQEFLASMSALTTALPNDVTIGSQGGVVQP